MSLFAVASFGFWFVFFLVLSHEFPFYVFHLSHAAYSMTLLPPSSAHAPGRFHSHLPLTFPLDRHHTLSPLAPLTPEHNEYSMRDKLKILIRSTRWRVALLTILLCDVTVLFVEILLSMFEKHPMPELEGKQGFHPPHPQRSYYQAIRTDWSQVVSRCYLSHY